MSLFRKIYSAQNTKVHTISQAYHRYTLNYINALNYLETLRRHAEFCEFEKVRTPYFCLAKRNVIFKNQCSRQIFHRKFLLIQFLILVTYFTDCELEWVDIANFSERSSEKAIFSLVLVV